MEAQNPDQVETNPQVGAPSRVERKLLTERVAALEKEVGILKTGLGIILESIFGPHEGKMREKTTDQMTPEEFDSELDKVMAEIFQGEESLDPDEALKRAIALRNK